MTSSTATATPARKPSDFAELSRSIRSAGLLKRRYGYYTARIAVNLLMLGGAWVAFAFIGNSWWQLFVAAFLAIVFAQLAFIGHDAGHKQIFRSKKLNDVLGYLHGGLVALSYGSWIKQHNQHHANPNHEGSDPDIEIPALAFTNGQAGAKRGVLRWIAKYQAVLFFPLLLLEGLNLRVGGAVAILRGEVRLRALEGALMVAHIAIYTTALFLVLSPGIAVLFIVVHQGLWGVYMGCSFAPNHKGMPTIPAGQKLDFLRKQVLTARNVRGGRTVDFVLGGLNYQIEHHLFPTMPRPNLRHAQRIVQRFCAEHGISYSQCGFFRSYGHVLRYLHQIGAPLRVRTV
ncbi:MAG: acyl-CoA desaturase [Actinophytocola sp.]|nr:acyl-CoA desaturase [Actinophytocola sp.]